ncbi:PREDICTED: lithostathine-1, partial [Ceratosolen solmsi marchali]|uniref:Lithostathine-1 n=1 Tax=Ceratosolen solmsi marchali TaxID=326594 RepID=A0AAJ7E137_9HYME
MTKPKSLAQTVEKECMNSSKAQSIGPWSAFLEDWIIYEENNSSTKDSRILKLDNTTIRITANKISYHNKREISDNDLYLLGAIEKLVYRIDLMERRLKKTEELLYSIVSDYNTSKDPCPEKYVRIGQFCYYFSIHEYNWKSSANLCRGMGGNLVEFETIEENQDVIAVLQNDTKLKNKDYWTGGLNPGLLWIWTASARPIYYDIMQNIIDNGRCLKLEYKTSNIYIYKGEDCGSKHRYICELSKYNESANKIDLIIQKILI